jgi:pre-rRNA-processing protein TSR2
MYERCRVGDYSVAADVCAKPLPRESVENSRRVEEDRRWTAGAAGAAGDGGGSDDDGGSEEDAEAMDADDLAAGLGEFSMRDGGDAGADGAGRRRNPEPDEDGWCTVPTRKR